ncbi:SRPBCC family protein [Terrabacter sp. 2YAF2]|uniref:SRPBCC family protein n=1 Tax=Terrabacter sp. 2YAF2 TaxID=3233026 RepID=UPI003F997359
MRRVLAPVVAPVVVGAAALAVITLRWSALHWGATTEETRERLPGDEILRDPGLVATRAITIEAPPEEVWRWVVQMGADRGGFYSYDRLENLAGCRLHSADTVVDDWQHLAVGDLVRLHPQVALTVAAVDPGRSFVLHAAPAMPGDPAAAPYDFTWSFVLRRHPHRATRLITRERFAYLHRWSPLFVEPVAVASSLMSQKMLRGIRDRAERRGTAGVGTVGIRTVGIRTAAPEP